MKSINSSTGLPLWSCVLIGMVFIAIVSGLVAITNSAKTSTTQPDLPTPVIKSPTILEKLDLELSEQKEILADIKSQGIYWKSFIIERQVTVAFSEVAEGEMRNMYSGYSASNYSEAIVLATDADIPENIYERLNLTLLVKPLGNRAFVKMNSYGRKYTVYAPLYEVVDRKLNPNAISAKIKALTSKINSMTTIAARNSKVTAK